MSAHFQYQFDLQTPLGDGAQGTVYLGTDRNTGSQVAIKVVELKNEAARANFLREIENLQQVHSPYVVKYLAHQDFDSQAYIAMEYIDGKPLEHLVPVNEDIALRWLRQMVVGLSAIWEKSIIHRDLKPGNILISSGGEVKICDFGISKCIEEVPGETFIGTVKYLAPEILRRKDYGFEADIWSLGVVFSEMLIGIIPGNSLSAESLLRKLKEKQVSEVPYELIRRMLKDNPRKRISKEDLIYKLQRTRPAFEYLHYESRLKDELGRGSQGGVSLGKDLRSGKPVAIKQLLLESPKAKMCFKQEIQNLQRVSSPYIVQYLDHLELDEKAYLILEYVSGSSLQKYLSCNKSGISEETVLYWFQEIVEGLATLWGKQIIHRDLKPANILITNQDLHVKICDFGISKCIEQTPGVTLIGTLKYMAPEVLRNEAYEYKADIWSLGVVFYEMLAGVVEEEKIDVKVLLGNLRQKQVSDWSYRLLCRMLEPDSNLRISHTDLIQELSTPVTKLLNKGDRCEIFLQSDSRTNTFRIKKTLQLRDQPVHNLEPVTDIPNLPSLVHCFESFGIDNSVVFVTEYCEGGDLRTFIENRGATYETTAKGLMWKLLKLLENLTNNDTVYRTIKAEHILLSKTDYNAEVKFSNFYITQKISEILREKRGEHSYLAPELLNNQHGSLKSAVWSLGCVFYFLLSGQHPIQSGLALKDVQKQIPPLSCVSWQCSDLVGKMLSPTISSRSTLRNCLSHEFFKPTLEIPLQTPYIDANVVQLCPLERVYKILGKTIELSKTMRDQNNLKAAYFLLQLMRLCLLKVDSLLLKPLLDTQIDFQSHYSALSTFNEALWTHITAQKPWAEYQFAREGNEASDLEDVETLPNSIFTLCNRMLTQQSLAEIKAGVEIMGLLYSAKDLLGTQRTESLRFHMLYNSLWLKSNATL